MTHSCETYMKLHVTYMKPPWHIHEVSHKASMKSTWKLKESYIKKLKGNKPTKNKKRLPKTNIYLEPALIEPPSNLHVLDMKPSGFRWPM